VVVVAVALVAVAAACGSSGRELSDPEPGATAPPRRPPAAGTQPTVSTTLATFFALTTDAWTPATEIPRQYTCDGENVSPPLVISRVPDGTAELAIVMTDPDADDFVHWVLTGIAPTSTFLEEGTVPAEAVQTVNGAGTVGWTGPCPPPGDGIHTYDFALYALPAPSGVTADTDPAAAIAAVQEASTTIAVLTGTYER
jgi:Raf kinase inhibitor-like YbhB/YbcL family protein